MEPVIRVNGLKKYFGGVKAVDDISFQVERGELFGFLGVNGAGKSTTVNMLCTLYQPTAGKIEICGLAAGQEDEEIRKRIGVVWQNNCLDDKLTVKENLFARGALYGKSRKNLRQTLRGYAVCLISRMCITEDLQSFPAGRKDGARLQEHWSTHRRSCFWMSRRPDLILLRGKRYGNAWRNCAGRNI